MLKNIKAFFNRQIIVHNHNDHSPNYILCQYQDSLYIMTKGGDLYRLVTDFSGEMVIQKVSTFQHY